MDTATLTAYLRSLRERYPPLGPLIERLGRGGMPTREFLSAYLASEAPPEIRSRLLRTVLGDPLLCPECAPFEPDLATYQRTAAFLREHPLAPADWREAGYFNAPLPKHVPRLFGLTAALGAGLTPWRFLEHFALGPYEHYKRTGQARLPDGRALPPGTSLAFLAPFYAARRPRVAALTKVLGTTGPGLHYDRLLPVAAPVLATRNAVALVAAVLNPELGGPKRQNHIPRPLTRYLGLLDLSVPQLLLFADLFTLAETGVLDTRALQPREDFMGLHALLNRWRAGIPVSERQGLLKALGGGHLLDIPGAVRLDPRQPSHRRRGIYESAVYCNLERLLARVPGRGGDDFRRFAPYYAAIDVRRLGERVMGHYAKVDAGFARWLGTRMQAYPEHFAGMHLRDMANTLFLAHQAQRRGEAVYFALPSVARFALGAREYARSARKSPTGRSRTPRAPADRVAYPLPLLEQLLGPVEPRPTPSGPQPGRP